MVQHISHTPQPPERPDPQELFSMFHDPARAALVTEQRLAAEAADLQDFRDDLREEIEAGRAAPEAPKRLGELTLVQVEVDSELAKARQDHPAGHRPS